MTILRTPSDDDVTGLAAELYAEDRAALGYVPSHTRVTALHPEAVRAFEDLVRAVAHALGTRRYELVTLAAARALGSRACLLAHGRKALSCMTAEELLAVARDHRDAGLDEAEVAMMDFAARLSTDSAAMTEADAQRLRDVGLSDREILDVALAAGARNLYSRTLHALAVEVDDPPGLDPELRDALLAGT
ncbi:carboxymuconolactone decarboxylase family protein [Cellulomonas sp. 179-A 9B4 NHS]|uniref:carboxymuconolactone decarboxylase family protein n=1 Tax=Cellulomonas sp. 179-A 9B4 NHS TaxID=3142379 RepID=UPI0039A25826